MLRVGFVVNPVAGMGGAVGLKGTDGEGVLKEAVSRGAKRQAHGRALSALSSVHIPVTFLTCSGEMGEEVFREASLGCEVVCHSQGTTSAHDTRAGVREFLKGGVDLVVFVGGDGTARDVLSEAADRVPIVGVPSGVKMHSAVFVNTPRDLGDILRAFERSKNLKEAEVLDIDEDSFREGVVSARLYGVALTPDASEHMQAGKQSYSSGTASEEADEIGLYISETMQPGVTYVVGPGSTTARVAKALGQPKTLLGVDVYRDRVRVLEDATETDLVRELKEHGDARIIVSPIGAQGFFFGRGNQQISPKVVRAVARGNIIVMATPSKLASTPVLRVDTGDQGLDGELRGDMRVVTGYKRRRLVKVA